MTPPVDLAAILRTHLAECLEADRQQHIGTPRGHAVYVGGETYENSDPLDDDLDLIGTLLEEAKEARARRDTQGVAHLINDLIQRFAVPKEQHRELGQGVLQVRVQALQEARRRITKGPVSPVELLQTAVFAAQTHPTPAPTLTAAPAPAPETSELFSVVFKEYLSLRAPDREDGMRGQTIDQNAATYRMFVEVVGDLPFKTITREHTSKFLGVLEQLPPLYSKSPEWRGMSLQEIVAAVESKPGVVKRMAKKTQQRHFAALSGLFEHLKRRKGYVGENPARGFKLKPKRKAKNDRDAWTAEELAQLFTSPVWAGCRSERWRTKPGPNIYRNAMYWVPILCAFHGARLEEMAQLRRCDVKQEEVRIPRMPVTHSTRSRSPIPFHGGHRFQLMPVSDSS